MSNEFTLESMINNNTTDQLIKALQVNLGYKSSTYLPSVDEFISDDYYLGKTTDNGNGIYPYWREELRKIFPNPLFVNYNTVFLRSAIN